jgi:hypothetical protein
MLFTSQNSGIKLQQPSFGNRNCFELFHLEHFGRKETVTIVELAIDFGPSILTIYIIEMTENATGKIASGMGFFERLHMKFGSDSQSLYTQITMNPNARSRSSSEDCLLQGNQRRGRPFVCFRSIRQSPNILALHFPHEGHQGPLLSDSKPLVDRG